MIVIPVDAHLITLAVVRTILVDERDPRTPTQIRLRKKDVTELVKTTHTAETLAKPWKAVNRIYAEAGLQFQLRSTTEESPIEAPRPETDRINSDDFMYLATKFPMNGAVSLMLIKHFEDAGGKSSEEDGVCAIPDNAPENALAHEFGHLLGLERDKPDKHDGDSRNLMTKGLSMPGVRLTPNQIVYIRDKSALVRRFSAPKPKKAG